MRKVEPISDNICVSSVIALVFVSALAWLTAIFACIDMIHRGSGQFEGKPLWLGVIVVAILASIADWLAWRVAHPKGPTAIPAWFIWLCVGFGLLIAGWDAVLLITKLLG